MRWKIRAKGNGRFLKYKFATIEKREGERHEDFASWRSASRKESE